MRYTNLNMDTTLGGSSASDEVIASQKAIKSYVDENDKDNITEMEDVDITEVSDGQVLSYDSSTNKWKNADATSVVIRKWN
jgi:hypothetical protein